jgi:hypothetical protein
MNELNLEVLHMNPFDGSDDSSVIPMVSLSSGISEVRRLLDAVAGTAGLSINVRGGVLIAAIRLMEADAPPPPVPDQEPSSDVVVDLRKAVDLLTVEAAQAPTAVESIRLATIARQVQGVLAILTEEGGLPPDPPDTP